LSLKPRTYRSRDGPSIFVVASAVNTRPCTGHVIENERRRRVDEEGFEFEEEEEQTLIFGEKLERNEKTPIKKRSLYTDESYIVKSALNCHICTHLTELN